MQDEDGRGDVDVPEVVVVLSFATVLVIGQFTEADRRFL